MSMNEEEFASFLWALENTGLAWAVDELRSRDTSQREEIAELRAALATQPAASEPEQQTAINADDLPTKKYPLAAFDFDSPATAPVAAGEPVAIANRGKCAFWVKWTDAAEGLYGPGIKLYAAPPAAAHGDEAVLTFEYVGPRNERKTVEVTREEVADHLDYMLFEKLTAAVCGCDPAESDDCRCDEYAEQFTMRAQAGEGGEV